MNFTQEIKRELGRSMPEKRCCKLALFSAFLDTSGYRSFGRVGREDEFSFTTEQEDTAEYLLSVAKELFGIDMTLTEAGRDPINGRSRLTFSYRGPGAGEMADEISSHTASEGLEECCAAAYLKGAFLGGGSCTVPRDGKKTGYHLEFVFPESSEAERFLELLERLQLLAGTVARGDTAVVYVKSREVISDFLSVMEAPAALRTLERVSAAREENNYENRAMNCASGNADRSATASVSQTMALAALKEQGTLDTLPSALRETAEARLAHPTYSLKELSEALGITKSCLNHRLRRLVSLTK